MGADVSCLAAIIFAETKGAGIKEPAKIIYPRHLLVLAFIFGPNKRHRQTKEMGQK